MNYFDVLDTRTIDGLKIIIDKTPEELLLDGLLDDSYDIPELEKQINSGDLDYFMLRVRAMFNEYELAYNMLGGCLYKNPLEVLTDGTVDDMIDETVKEAKVEVVKLMEGLSKII